MKETINLHDYAKGKDLNPDYSFMVTKERVDLAEAMVRSRRFAGLNLSDYCSVLDKEVEKQSAAMIFSLPELGYQQIVFRGTDDSVIGWKKSFQLTYSREIPAHPLSHGLSGGALTKPQWSYRYFWTLQGWQSCPLFGCPEFTCLA
ncbi:DUF2974 domain-containing protein [Streptococcus thermophilus]|nr:Mbeg1-like protein [Streptococcus thermophilus]MDA5519383.1 DUF2974 domain-containing protein [Streptococcus thermophilus]